MYTYVYVCMYVMIIMRMPSSLTAEMSLCIHICMYVCALIYVVSVLIRNGGISPRISSAEVYLRESPPMTSRHCVRLYIRMYVMIVVHTPSPLTAEIFCVYIYVCMYVSRNFVNIATAFAAEMSLCIRVCMYLCIYVSMYLCTYGVTVVNMASSFTAEMQMPCIPHNIHA